MTDNTVEFVLIPNDESEERDEDTKVEFVLIPKES